jgi:hypothetical protein
MAPFAAAAAAGSILIGTVAIFLASVEGYSVRPTTAAASRRQWLHHQAATAGAAVAVAVGTTVNPAIASAASSASAASTAVTASELERLRLGHARIRYLLDHWKDVTSVCGTTVMSDSERRQVVRTEGGGNCLSTPLRVQEFMGYKSTTDPLYRADRLMVRAGTLVDPGDFENYLDVVERYREKADQTALLAYTSSWGEANPYVFVIYVYIYIYTYIIRGILCCWCILCSSIPFSKTASGSNPFSDLIQLFCFVVFFPSF